MRVQVSPVDLQEIVSLRDLYRQEMNAQIVHDSHFHRGFNQPYLVTVDDRVAGYGAVGDYYTRKTEIIKEFYLLPAYRANALALFRELIAAGNATCIQAQSNDRLLTLMLYDCAGDITSDTILFEDGGLSHLTVPGAVVRRTEEADKPHIPEHHGEPVGDRLVEHEGAIVGTGGFLCHYNLPYGDLYMEIAEPYRRRGFGSYLIQELKRVCYEAGKRPAARCNVENAASRATLQKAGMLPCARILRGTIR